MNPVTLARRSGEQERFIALYAAHAGAVLAFARRRVSPDEAEDVLAETFLVVWRRRDDVPADDALPWLYAVAGNVVRNRRRSERRRVALQVRMASSVPVAEDAPDPGLHEALARLNPIDREALLLTAWEGLDTDRAARAAGCSRATFHVRLHRARRRLAEVLEEQS